MDTEHFCLRVGQESEVEGFHEMVNKDVCFTEGAMFCARMSLWLVISSNRRELDLPVFGFSSILTESDLHIGSKLFQELRS